MRIDCKSCGYLFTYVDDGNREYGLNEGTDYHIDEIKCPHCKYTIIVRWNLDYSKVDFSKNKVIIESEVEDAE